MSSARTLRGRAAAREPAVAPDEGGDVLRSLSLGYLAMLPLLASYEWALAAFGDGRRNAGELLLGLATLPFGATASTLRIVLLALLALPAIVVVHRRGGRVRAGVARVMLEGLAAALLLGPLLVALLALLDGWLPRLDVSWDPHGQRVGLAPAALVLGGAAWEELAFRVGLYSLLFLLARRFLQAFDAPAGLARWGAEAVGLVGSAALFALAHLADFTRWLGGGGAAFDPALFTWLALAGMLLGALFRLRGPGVAAWAHGLFNLALLIGIDPDVLA